jgi:hypothetical protein
MMSMPLFDAPKRFRNVVERFAVHISDRGEYIGLLLLILARDQTIGAPNNHGHPARNHSFFDVVPFLSGHLFRDPVDMIRNAISPQSADALKESQHDFPDAKMHFNHFVKLHDYKSIDKLCLLPEQLMFCVLVILVQSMLLMSFCALAQSWWSIILALSFTRSTMTPGIITTQSHRHLKPDLYQLGILNAGAAAPVIKIFFALAAKIPCRVVMRHEPTFNYNAVRVV